MNYVATMRHGMQRIQNGELPLCGQLLKELHLKLMAEVRGGSPNLTPAPLRPKSDASIADVARFFDLRLSCHTLAEEMDRSAGWPFSLRVSRDRMGRGAEGGGDIALNDGAYALHGSYRWMCRSSGGCRVEDRVVRQGTIVETIERVVVALHQRLRGPGGARW